MSFGFDELGAGQYIVNWYYDGVDSQVRQIEAVEHDY